VKKILVITYYWPPSGGAGVQRWLKFVKYLNYFNIEPIVITVIPEYAAYPKIDKSLENDIKPCLRIYKTKAINYYRFFQLLAFKREIPDAGFAKVKEVTFFEKIVRFLRSNIFIPDPRKGWNYFAIKEAEKIINSEKIDTIITTSPPHSTQLIGLKLKKKYKLKWVADLRDPWTDIYYYKELYHSFISKNIDKKYEKKVIEKADKIITVSENLKNIFLSKVNIINSEKIHTIPNGFDDEDFQVTDIKKDAEFVITYTGSITKEYPTSVFIKAFKQNLKNGFNIKLKFIGDIHEKLKDEILKEGLSKFVEFYQYMNHYEIIKFLLRSSAFLLIIPKTRNNECILTGKLFEYIGASRPIIGLGPVNGDAAKIIKENNFGKVFDYEDFENLSKFINDLVLNKFNYPINYDLNLKYSRKNLTEKLSKILLEEY
jgi:glycosyltransferase involved in cell wall biosynthesis